VIRERNGNSLPAVFRSEGQALSFIKSRIAKGTVVHADEAGAWNDLHGRYEMKRINHQEAYSLDGACTNWAEEFSAACAAPRSAITITSLARTFSAMRKRLHGGRTAGGSRMANR
jgi:hypothetical protein